MSLHYLLQGELNFFPLSKIGMICFAKPRLTKDLYIVQKKEFSVTWYMCDMYTWQRKILFIRDNAILSSDRLHKDYDSKGLIEKQISGRGSQGACCQAELIGGKRKVTLTLKWYVG
jgi:hypothetical protein